MFVELLVKEIFKSGEDVKKERVVNELIARDTIQRLAPHPDDDGKCIMLTSHGPIEVQAGYEETKAKIK